MTMKQIRRFVGQLLAGLAVLFLAFAVHAIVTFPELKTMGVSTSGVSYPIILVLQGVMPNASYPDHCTPNKARQKL